MPVSAVDINCDLGEGHSENDLARDARIMDLIDRCNIACGGHAGNQHTMQTSIENASQRQLKIGAHPGYPDPQNFGRVSLTLETDELLDSIGQQVTALLQLAEAQKVALAHIKLHGALYNDAESNDELADKLACFLFREFPAQQLLVLAGGAMQRAAASNNIKTLAEGFMDRAYQSNGLLVPRSQPGAVLKDIEAIVGQAIKLCSRQTIASIDNQPLDLKVDSVCLHGDGENAETIARALKQKLAGHSNGK